MHGAEEFSRIAQLLQREREVARGVVAEIRLDPSRALDEALPSTRRTLGLVYELSEAARSELTRVPERSLHLAQLAAAVAGDLATATTYPRVLRAQAEALAWKDVSNALRFRSEYAGALAALDLADRRIADEVALGLDRALLALARATTLREMARSAEAVAVASEALRTFRDYGDAARIAQCELVIGMAHHNLGALTAARQAYLRVVAAARAADDLHTLAAAYNNLARAASEEGDTNAAIDALQQARAIFRELEMPVQIARVSWSIGTTVLLAGRFADAQKTLREVRGEFLEFGMPEEAGLAGVDLIESLLATGERAAARELAVAITSEFTAAGLNERALQAVSYLRDTADVATPATAQYVAGYLRRLKDQPTLRFIAPQF